MTAREKAAEKAANVSQPRDYRLIVEKDVKIPMRDGTLLYADIFRPDGGVERFPAIMNISVYQKDRCGSRRRTSRRRRTRT
jgi:predicted acyl esterase